MALSVCFLFVFSIYGPSEGVLDKHLFYSGGKILADGDCLRDL